VDVQCLSGKVAHRRRRIFEGRDEVARGDEVVAIGFEASHGLDTLVLGLRWLVADAA
jgi:hypothetical protein